VRPNSRALVGSPDHLRSQQWRRHRRPDVVPQQRGAGTSTSVATLASVKRRTSSYVSAYGCPSRIRPKNDHGSPPRMGAVFDAGIGTHRTAASPSLGQSCPTSSAGQRLARRQIMAGDQFIALVDLFLTRTDSSSQYSLTGTAPWHTRPMTSREDVHRLLDAVPEARLPALEQILRASLHGPVPTAPRRFASAGTLSAEHDLAERSEDILREGPTDA
jgi:hypothetical protein